MILMFQLVYARSTFRFFVEVSLLKHNEATSSGVAKIWPMRSLGERADIMILYLPTRLMTLMSTNNTSCCNYTPFQYVFETHRTKYSSAEHGLATVQQRRREVRAVQLKGYPDSSSRPAPISFPEAAILLVSDGDCDKVGTSYMFCRSMVLARWVAPQVAQARNMSIGEHRHCCVTFKI